MLVYLRTHKETLRVRKNPDRPYLGSSSFITYQLYQRRNKMSGWCVLTEPVLALLVFSGAPCSWWLFHSSLGPQVEEFIFSPFLFMISSIPSVAKLATEVFHRSPVMTAVASAVTVSHEAHRSDCLPGPPYHDRPTDLKWSLTAVIAYLALHITIDRLTWNESDSHSSTENPSVVPLWTGHHQVAFLYPSRMLSSLMNDLTCLGLITFRTLNSL